MNFIEAIIEAQKEAFKQSIRANAIFINKGFASTNEIVFSSFNTVQIVKPMILGLKAEITDELPEEFAFAISDVDDEKLMTEQEKQIRKDTARDILQNIYNHIGFEELSSDNNAYTSSLLAMLLLSLRRLIKSEAQKYEVEININPLP